MSYKSGYKFCVQSTRDSQNREIKHKLFTKRFSDRIDTNDGFIYDLDDGTLLQVVSYNNGAVWVVVVDNSEVKGYLG